MTKTFTRKHELVPITVAMVWYIHLPGSDSV